MQVKERDHQNAIILANILEVSVRVVNKMSPKLIGDTIQGAQMENTLLKHILVNKIRHQLDKKITKKGSL